MKLRCDQCDATWEDPETLACPACGHVAIVVAEDATKDVAEVKNIHPVNPYQAPTSTRAAPTKFGASGIALIAAGALITLPTLVLLGGPSAPLLMVAFTAILRTNSAVSVLRMRGAFTPTAGTWAIEFLKSLFVTSMVGIATTIAFFAICTGTFVLAGESGAFMVVGVVVMCLIPLAIYVELLRRTWPR